VLGFRLTRRVGLGALGVVGALLLAAACTLEVPPGHRGLVRRFGVPRAEDLGEGLHFKLPPPLELARVVPADAVRRLEIGYRSAPDQAVAPLAPGIARASRGLEEESVFLTGDENLIATTAVLQYRVTDASRYAWGFRDPDGTLRLITIAETLDVLARHPIDGVYTGERAVVESKILDGVRDRSTRLDLGVEILAYCLSDVHAPPEVHAAFRDVASAQEDKETAINVAYRFQDETINLARGEAARLVEEARAQSQTQTMKAEGDSRSLKARAGAYREWRVGTDTRLYLETVEEVLAGNRKIVRPGWKGSGDVDLWISTGQGDPAPVTDVIRGSDVRRAQRDPQEESSP
jgi:membrane protease subunit HflK